MFFVVLFLSPKYNQLKIETEERESTVASKHVKSTISVLKKWTQCKPLQILFPSEMEYNQNVMSIEINKFLKNPYRKICVSIRL